MTATPSDAIMGMGGFSNINSKVQQSTINLSISSIEKTIDVLDIDSSSISPL
ncbi:hypothetical protein I4U23_004210 [Adineta vaga]|nr:hypothetical protein I4U23_004210 [Adineta vaga]